MKLPSLFRVIEIDYYAYLAVLLPAGFWIVMMLAAAIQTQNLERAFIVGYVLTAGGAVVLGWRYMRIGRILSGGQTVTGTVQRTWFFRDRARITCVYIFKGQKYLSSQPMRFSRRATGLKAGDKVRLALDAKNPRIFLVQQLFE